MVVQVIRTRLCDLENCTETASELRLRIDDRHLVIDLCPGHRDLVTYLPWRKDNRRLATREDRATARMYARYDRRIRLPDGTHVVTPQGLPDD
jgi:hypothetical protein